jgi:hypothetical protein
MPPCSHLDVILIGLEDECKALCRWNGNTEIPICRNTTPTSSIDSSNSVIILYWMSSNGNNRVHCK